VAKLARRYHVPHVRWHWEVLPGRWPPAPRTQRRSSLILNWLGRLNATVAPELRATAATWGVAHTGFIDAEWLQHAAESLPDGVTEIVVHPGLVGELDAGATRLLGSRTRELEALCDPAVKKAFERNGIEFTHYGRL
jgi:predicted glycoside hydrolase/deacetylase ChbG (UPF0249 family)